MEALNCILYFPGLTRKKTNYKNEELNTIEIILSDMDTESSSREIQLRSERTGLFFTSTPQEAIDYVRKDRTVWKVSFDFCGIDFRLVWTRNSWVNIPVPHPIPTNDELWREVPIFFPEVSAFVTALTQARKPQNSFQRWKLLRTPR